MAIKSEKSDQFLENDIPSLEERVTELLTIVYGHEGPFTEDQQNKARQAVLERLAELTVEELGPTVSEDDEMQSDNQQEQIVAFPESKGDKTPADQPQEQIVAFAASESDKTPADNPQTPEEQTSDDELRVLDSLAVKGDELSFVADNQGVYVHVNNATDKELSKLVLKKEGKEKTFELLPSDRHYGFYLIKKITEPEMAKFIADHKQSPKTPEITMELK